jgi:alpha-tubulin suppressor-like RCC1 family protein
MQQGRTPLPVRAIAAVVCALAAIVPVSAGLVSSPVGATTTGVAFTSVEVGTTNACALSSAKTLYCWGTNHYGQLLNGTTVPRYTPTPINLRGVLGAGQIVQFATGNGTTCVLDNLSNVYCWGYGGQGQLGNGLYLNAHGPVRVAFTSDRTGSIVQLTGTGATSFCALTSTSQVWCWGGNVYGQLGDNKTINSDVPVLVEQPTSVGSTAIVDVAGRDQTFCELTSTGKAYCWGFGLAGALGNNTSRNALTPSAVTSSGALSGKQLVSIAPATDHTCALDSQANVYCWGSNRNGTDGLDLPNGATHSSSWRLTPQYVGGMSGLQANGIASSYSESCSTTATGKLYCWGAEPLGDGLSSGIQIVPTLVSDPAIASKTVIAVSAGDLGTCAIIRDGSLYCWGQNTTGVVGDGTANVVATPELVSSSSLSGPVASVPSAPIGVSVSPLTGSLIVTWSPPSSDGNVPILSYSATTTPNGGSCVTTKLSCTIHSLSPSVGYTVTVIARNVAGTGIPATSGIVFPIQTNRLTVLFSSRVQSANIAFPVVVAGLKQGTKITIVLANAPTQTCVMTQIKQCYVIEKQPRYGTFRVVAKTGGIVATNFFYTPQVVTPAKIIHGHTATIRVASCPPQGAVTITLSDGRRISALASSTGLATMLVPMPKRGRIGVLTQVSGTQIVPDKVINVL